MRDAQPEETFQTIEGRNVCLEAFRSGKTVDRIHVQKEASGPVIREILKEAKNAGLRVRFEEKEQMDRMSETGNHQGVIARIAGFRYVSTEEILQRAAEKGEAPFLLMLDGIEDPHNFGAILRSANQAGVHGVIVREDRSSPMSAAAARASAGAFHYTPVARVKNLTRTIEALKKEGIWFAAADMGGTVMYDVPLTGPLCIVIGNEGAGVSRLVLEACDYIVRIPMFGEIDSLNASVAAGVLAYEAVRQRMKKG